MQACRVARKDRHDRHDWALALSEFRSLDHVYESKTALWWNSTTPGLIPAYLVSVSISGLIDPPTKRHADDRCGR